MGQLFLTQKNAQKIDQELFLTFSVDQLMELAGLSVAEAIYQVYPPSSHPNPMIIVGPGNNGGDGLVAARHLKHFGYHPSIIYPKQSQKPLFLNLVAQLEQLDIPFLNQIQDSDLIVDAVFGFSFTGPIRAPFDTLLLDMTHATCPIVSIDIPSGWDVEQGPLVNAIQPEMLISLTFPKECAKHFKGKHHFLGGRFIPPSLSKKYGFSMPEFPRSAQCVRLY